MNTWGISWGDAWGGSWGGEAPPPAPAEASGTGAVPLKPSYRGYREWRRQYELDRKLQAAIDKANREREEEELGAVWAFFGD